ncbi:hypothetical protein [Halostella salina]|uniref:hypothetical protein n=1 Tax=Halostella salina TaxID=1547897 RepID=UPI000EF7F465|nr:hypothetical protein [Halostella salina]
MTRERATDALSALAVGLVPVVLLARRGATPTSSAIAAGAAGALLLEAVLFRHRERVRRLWKRPGVRWGATLVAVGLAVAVGPRAPDWALWALLGGVGGYLSLLVAVTVKERTGAD